MALITEDGTARSNAESLCTVAFATTYHSDRGNAAWAALASDTVREQCLRKATEYMGQVYRLRWKGSRTTTTQALDWPRYAVPLPDSFIGGWVAYLANNVVPVEVQRACAELALRASAGDLAPDVSPQTIREKVDVIEVEYAPGALPFVSYRAIDNLLAPFLADGSGSSVPVVRA